MLVVYRERKLIPRSFALICSCAVHCVVTSAANGSAMLSVLSIDKLDDRSANVGALALMSGWICAGPMRLGLLGASGVAALGLLKLNVLGPGFTDTVRSFWRYKKPEAKALPPKEAATKKGSQ